MALTALVPPESAVSAKRLLAFCKYFRDFIEHFAAKTTNLRKFSSAATVDKMRLAQEVTFLKNELIKALPLRPVLINGELVAFCDYSSVGLGAVLMFCNKVDKQLYISRFLSRSLRGVKSQYATIEGEALVLLFLKSEKAANNSREIIWVYDLVGNSRKSYLSWLHEAFMLVHRY